MHKQLVRGPVWQRMNDAFRAHVGGFVAGAASGAAAIVQYPVVLPLKIIGQAAPAIEGIATSLARRRGGQLAVSADVTNV